MQPLIGGTSLEEAIAPSGKAPDTISPSYTAPLTAQDEAHLTAFAETTSPENLGILLEAYCNMLNDKFKDFAEPTALESRYGGATMIASGSMMMCLLDYAEPDEGEALMDYG